ncbi:DUF1835 domain-containing protein [Pelagibius sp. 7325]|uniref:DUF1835 domain-containing protein n=1 Tax=Pelagibius sp. 7325 TaxID=3131994 RepID=UPI0030EC5856
MINDPSKTLHVVSGGSAAGCLKQALRVRNHQVLVGDSDLHCGPAPMMDDLIAWHRIRKVYSDTLFETWHRAMSDHPLPPTVSFGDEPEIGPHIDGERLAEAPEVVVWVTQGLADQLLLTWIVFLFDRFKFDHAKLRVVEFEHSHQKWPLVTIGMLSPEAINRLNPGAKPLGSDQIEELRRAWQAYTASDPGLLVDYLADPGLLPFLHRAMAELIYRYPDVRTGLSRWDEVLLRQTIENGPLPRKITGYAMAFSDTPDWVRDPYLYDRLTKLGGLGPSSPLVSLSSSQPLKKQHLVEITDFGRKVLAGEANHVAENGIDDWVGGVHLTPDTVVFRDGDRLLMT